LVSPMQRECFAVVQDCNSYPTPFGLFDKNDSAKSGPKGGDLGSIPYGLKEWSTGKYYTTMASDAGYYTTSLQGFYNPTDNGGNSEIQAVSGGTSVSAGGNCYFYPSKSPLTEGLWYQSLCAGSWTFDGPVNGITSNQNGIMTVGGPKANGISRYFNDFNFAIDRESTGPTDIAAVINNGGVATGAAPTSDPKLGTLDFYPVSSWATNPQPAGPGTIGYSDGTSTTIGYAVISIAHDVNGTRGLSVYGWNGRDTYWAAAWASQWIGERTHVFGNGNPFNWLPAGTTSIILQITYPEAAGANPTWEPEQFTIVQALGTITQLGFNQFISSYGAFDTFASYDTLPSHAPAPWASIIFGGAAVQSQANNVLPGLSGGTSLTYYNLPGTDVGAIKGPPLFAWFSAKINVDTTASVQFDG